MTIDELMSEALQRERRKKWADEIGRGVLDFSGAVQKVAEVLKDQLVTQIDGPGHSFFIGFLCCNEIFGTLAPGLDQIRDAILKSKVDYDTYSALRFLGHITPAGVWPELDDWKTQIFLEVFHPPLRSRGPSRFELIHRDMLLVSQVVQLEAVGFRPTRSIASKRDRSGCDVVATATHRLDGPRGMTYSAVERVWKKRDPALLKNVANEFARAYIASLDGRRSS